MSEKLGTVFSVRQKEYVIPADLVIGAPKVHANNVQVVINNEEVSLVFATKVDSMTTETESDVAIPQVVVYMSLSQASALQEVMQKGLERIKAAIVEHQAELEKSVAKQ